EFETGAFAALAVIAAAKCSRITRQAAQISLVRRDAIDDAADCVAAVEKSRRASDDFDAVEREHVNRFDFVGRLRSNASETQSILKHQHAVAVEAANDRTPRARSKTALGNSSLIFKSFAN